MKTYAMMILGCKVNDYEATYIREKMNQHYQEIDFRQKADIYLIFTCCVTNTAEAKTRKFIHDARRNNPNAYIAAIGCLSQIKSDSEVFSDVDLIIGSDQKDRIMEFIMAQDRNNHVHKEISKNFEHLYIESYPEKSRSFLKIQDGCNQFCSFCVIPYARGRERNADHLEILKEAEVLSKTNKEIVLTGIHTGRYHDKDYVLSDLLNDLSKIDGLYNIRLSSIEITEITDEIIALIKENPKIAPHLHIPVQSCDNTILKAMNRPYTIEEFMERVAYIRSMIPDISISTDLIVGFPGENDELFENTVQKLKEINFSFIHVFPYSRKSGTVADKMENHIDPKIKKQRVRKVIDLQKDLTLNFKKRFESRNLQVLIERNRDGFSFGYSREYIYVKCEDILEVGSVYEIEIDNVDEEVIGHALKRII